MNSKNFKSMLTTSDIEASMSGLIRIPNEYRIHRIVLIGILGFAALLSLACIGLMGAEYDEAWITASAHQAFGARHAMAVRPVTTTGGLHFLIIGLTGWIPGNPLVPARILSFLAVSVLLVAVVRQLGTFCISSTERLILSVTCISAPGTVLIAGMGYGIALALLLFILGMLVGLRDARISVPTAILAGLLLGLALATRWTLIPALPAVLLWACHSPQHRRANLVAGLIAGAVAVTLLLLLVWAQSLVISMGNAAVEGIALRQNLEATGLRESLPSPTRRWSFLVKLVTVLPISLLVAAVTVYFVPHEDDRHRRFVLVLMGSALLILLAWMLLSPAMHLRYVWPVYMLVAICAGLGFVNLHRRAAQSGSWELLHLAVALPVLLVVGQFIIAVRLIALGTAAQINNAGYENLENHYNALYHVSEQRSIVEYLQSLDPDTTIGGLYLPGEVSALELSVLSDRPLRDLILRQGGTAEEDASLPDRLIVHAFSPISSTGQAWLDTLGPPLKRIAGYSVYDLSSATYLPPKGELIIDPELYRFGPAPWLSLTGY